MDVHVMVCTFGSQEWMHRGLTVMSRTTEQLRHHRGVRVTAHYVEGGTLAEVRNLAATEPEMEWLCFLDADDHLNDGYLVAMENAYLRWSAARPFATILTDDGIRETSHRVLAVPPLLAPALSFDDGRTSAIPNKGRWPMMNECVIGTLVSRNLFVAVGGFNEWPSCEDYDLWLRCARAGAEIVHVPDAVYCAARPGPHSRNRSQTCVPAIQRANASLFRGRP